jgi:hypothetical protein
MSTINNVRERQGAEYCTVTCEHYSQIIGRLLPGPHPFPATPLTEILNHRAVTSENTQNIKKKKEKEEKMGANNSLE